MRPRPAPRPTPRSRPHAALVLLLGAACATPQPVTTATPGAAPATAPTLAFPGGDVVEQYGASELALQPGTRLHRDAAGQRYLVREAEDPRQGCELLAADEPLRALGRFGVPDDSQGFDRCAYLGGAPAGADASSWVLASVGVAACAYQVDELLAAIRDQRPARCGVALSQTTSPTGAPPTLVGWLSPHHVVLKTAHCCGSSKYHLVDLDDGRAVGLGMSFESPQHRQFPALRPFDAARPDFWIVQRSEDPQAEFPTHIAAVHCGQLLRYLETGQGAQAELRVDGRRLLDGSTLSIPSEVQPCPRDLELFPPVEASPAP